MTPSRARSILGPLAGPMLALCLAPALALAQVGPVGPIGPVGPTGTGAQGAGTGRTSPSAGAAPAASAKPVAPSTTTATHTEGNRLEVTGNTATRTGCGPDGAPVASVNSIQVDRESLQGRTVIVQGRNSSDVDVRPCPQAGPGGESAPAVAPGTQVNSIRVR